MRRFFQEPLPRKLVRVENFSQLTLLALRGILGWRFAAALLILVGIGYYLAGSEGMNAPAVHVLLGRLFLIFALVIASPLLPDERARGTLEILWLSCGSLRGLLRLKLGVLTAGIVLCAVPAVLISSWYLNWELDIVRELIFLLTQTLLVAAWVFFIGTYFPHAWAGGLVASALLLTMAWPLSTGSGTFNPFFQFYLSPTKTNTIGAFLFNRFWTLALAWFFYDQAIRRARRWLRE
jgi:hypothetical protein